MIKYEKNIFNLDALNQLETNAMSRLYFHGLKIAMLKKRTYAEKSFGIYVTDDHQDLKCTRGREVQPKTTV